MTKPPPKPSRKEIITADCPFRQLTRTDHQSPLRFLRRRLGRLLYCSISLPAFVFQLDMLDSDRIRVSIQVWQDFVFRNPTTMDLVSEHELSSVIIKLKNNLFAEVFQ